MNGQQLAVLGVLLLVGIGGAAAPVAGFPATVIAAGAPADQGGSTANNTTMGTQISSFMQTSAASAEGGVESGMWQAQFENAPSNKRAALVNQRVEVLQKRLQKLEERRAALLEGDEVTMAERAKAARLAAQAESLRDAINGTERAAEQAGVNTTKLNELRKQARNLTGQEVSQLAPGRGNGKNTQTGPGATPGNNDTGPDGEHPPKSGPPNDQSNVTVTTLATPDTVTTQNTIGAKVNNPTRANQSGTQSPHNVSTGSTSTLDTTIVGTD